MRHLATWIEEGTGKHYPEVFPPGEFRLWNAQQEAVPWNQIQGLVLTGGHDISADFLRQEIDESLIKNPDPVRDAWDFPALERALALGIPILAICRGLQVLNVARGGRLLLDIPGHEGFKYDNVQILEYAPETEIQVPQVNSSHHQAIDQLGNGLKIEARHTSDGIIEQIRLHDYPFCLGVQFHPERNLPIYSPIFDAFLRHLPS